MRAFGGHIIPQTVLSEVAGSRDVYSFATIFQTYRSLQISPGLGVTMSKESWQAIPSMPSVPSPEARPAKVMWSGDLLCTDTLQCKLANKGLCVSYFLDPNMKLNN